MDDHDKQSNDRNEMTGMAVGVSLGIAIGAATGNLALWAPLGIIIGAAMAEERFPARLRRRR